MLSGLLKFLLAILLFILGMIALMPLPSPQPDAPKPWEITLQNDGTVTVFNVHLGNTTYREVQQLWRERNELAIFAEADQPASAEVFFEQLNFSGLSSRVVLSLAQEQETLAAMQLRARSATLQPSGARRYIPTLADQEILLDSPVYAITYVPSVKVAPEMLHARFGEPDLIQPDMNDAEAEIWHYSALGLTVRLHPKDRPVFTYQNPDALGTRQ